jgi:hypothetical protein
MHSKPAGQRRAPQPNSSSSDQLRSIAGAPPPPPTPVATHTAWYAPPKSSAPATANMNRKKVSRPTTPASSLAASRKHTTMLRRLAKRVIVRSGRSARSARSARTPSAPAASAPLLAPAVISPV